jgi:hypothetical protein
MEESRTQRLQQLLRRLGQAVQSSVASSEEVRDCLDQLHEDGWRAVMLLQSSLVCRDGGGLEANDGSIHIHVEPDDGEISYRIDAEDARWLSTLGISPTRHRSRRTGPRSEVDDESGR